MEFDTIEFRRKLTAILAYLPGYEADDLENVEQVVSDNSSAGGLFDALFLPGLEKRGKHYVQMFVHICNTLALREMSARVVKYCIDFQLVVHKPTVATDLLIEIVRAIIIFRLEAHVDVGNEPQCISLQTERTKLEIPIQILNESDCLNVLEVIYTRYCDLLAGHHTDTDIESNRAIENYQATITLVRSLERVNRQMLLSSRWAWLLIRNDLRYSSSNIAMLFPSLRSLGPTEYDELVRRYYNVFLFPSLDNFCVVDTHLFATNLGPGSIQDPCVLILQEGRPPIKLELMGIIQASEDAGFRLESIDQRRILQLNPKYKSVGVEVHFRKYGRIYRLAQTVSVDLLIDPLRNAVGSSIIPVHSSLDLRDLVRSFFVDTICHRVEQDQGYKTLTEIRESKRVLRSEDNIQTALKHWLDELCKPYGIDISREANTGRGPMDLKLSIGEEIKCVVEVKLWDGHLEHGLAVQLPTYLLAEKARYGIYVVVTATKDERSDARYHDLEMRVQELNASGDFNIDIVRIYALKKPSASKADNYDDPGRYSPLN